MISQLFRLVKQSLLTLTAAVALVACDPCDGVVCENGTCANGTCICEPGYERLQTACLPVNRRYVAKSDSLISASLLVVDSQGNSNSFSNIGYTFTVEDNKPFEFTLKRFDFISDNDIVLQINPNKYNVLEGATVVTGAGRSYTYSGGRVGSQVQLEIVDVQMQKTNTITYQM